MKGNENMQKNVQNLKKNKIKKKKNDISFTVQTVKIIQIEKYV